MTENHKLNELLNLFNIEAEKDIKIRQKIEVELKELLDVSENKKLIFTWLCYFKLHYVFEGLEELFILADRYYQAKDELDGWISMLLGDIKLFLMYKYEEVIKHYQTSVELAPKCVNNWAALAECEMRLGNNQDAKRHLEIALSNLIELDIQFTASSFDEIITGVRSKYAKDYILEMIERIKTSNKL